MRLSEISGFHLVYNIYGQDKQKPLRSFGEILIPLDKKIVYINGYVCSLLSGVQKKSFSS